MSKHTLRGLTIVSCLNILRFTAFGQTPGIPEPGVILYGTITNSNGDIGVMPTTVNWSISGGGSFASITATLVNVNGQPFYIARVPFETRSASGVNFSSTPNTLPLASTATTFSRSASVNGVNAILNAPSLSSFPFGGSDRGKVERVNLTASLGPPLDSSLDSDGDGMSDLAEQIAGTDPNSINSVLKLSADVTPASGEGLTISWSSVPGKTYSIWRTSSLGTPFSLVGPSIPSGGASTSYIDATATGVGPFFYRIQVK